MSPVITLLTDFGVRDTYVGEMKGVLLSVVPDATLVDITHDVSPGNVASGQFLLSRTWWRFPAGTVHLAVVDPGVGSSRRAIAAAGSGHFFVAPDNGLLTPMFTDAMIVALPVPDGASPTFHGRDLFAPTAARLAMGATLDTLGEPVRDPVVLPPSAPTADGVFMVGKVVHVDRFGTLITDAPSALLEGVSVVLVGGEVPVPIGRTFADVSSGDLIALVGSGNTLEIAARDRSAAQAIGVGVGAEVRFRHA
jgi:S-adenosylmethionine hydrolase